MQYNEIHYLMCSKYKHHLRFNGFHKCEDMSDNSKERDLHFEFLQLLQVGSNYQIGYCLRRVIELSPLISLTLVLGGAVSLEFNQD